MKRESLFASRLQGVAVRFIAAASVKVFDTGCIAEFRRPAFVVK